MPNNKKICLAGSHHTPAIELIRQLKASPKTWRISYLTHSYPTETHIKNTIIPKLKVDLRLIYCNKFDRQKPFVSILKTPLLLIGIIQSLIILKKTNPEAIVSFGGYVSVPVVIAGWILKIPSITHEQTLTISLATKINSYFCQKIALSFPISNTADTLPLKKTVITGNLLRQEIFDSQSPQYRKLASKIKKSPLIYITGGSQGSQFINDLTANLLPRLNRYTIIHQTGRKPTPNNQQYPYYHPTEYVGLEDIGWIFHHSRLIITRAGANICQEIAALHHPAIVIPHPRTQQNEQIKNAKWLKSKLPKIITILPQSKATPAKVLLAISRHLRFRQKLRQPATDQPAHPLIKLINELA